MTMSFLNAPEAFNPHGFALLMRNVIVVWITLRILSIFKGSHATYAHSMFVFVAL